MNVSPQFYCPPPELFLCACDVRLGLRHARRNREERSDDCLRSNSLDPVDWTGSPVITRMHPDV